MGQHIVVMAYMLWPIGRVSVGQHIVMAYIVMAYRQVSVGQHIVMAYLVVAYIVMAYIVMAYGQVSVGQHGTALVGLEHRRRATTRRRACR